MKNVNRIATIIIVFTMLLTLFPLCASAAVKISAPKVIFMDINTKAQLKLTASSQVDFSKLPIAYSSSDVNIATIDSTGMVTGLRKGMATLTIKYAKQVLKIQLYISEPFMSYSDTSTFCINFPTCWKVGDSTMRSIGVVTLISPPHDGWMEMLQVQKFDLDAPSLKVNASIADNWDDICKEKRDDYKLIKSWKDTINGLPARLYEYTFSVETTPFKGLDCVVYDKNDLFSMSYFSIVKNYPLYYIEALRMFNSFTLL